MSKTFPKKIESFSMSVFPRFFGFIAFYRVFGCFSAMGVEKHYKKRFAEKIVLKLFTKNSTKNPKPIFLDLFFTFLGVSR
jgi:hypothetical protein